MLQWVKTVYGGLGSMWKIKDKHNTVLKKIKSKARSAKYPPSSPLIASSCLLPNLTRCFLACESCDVFHQLILA